MKTGRQRILLKRVKRMVAPLFLSHLSFPAICTLPFLRAPRRHSLYLRTFLCCFLQWLNPTWHNNVMAVPLHAHRAHATRRNIICIASLCVGEQSRNSHLANARRGISVAAAGAKTTLCCCNIVARIVSARGKSDIRRAEGYGISPRGLLLGSAMLVYVASGDEK